MGWWVKDHSILMVLKLHHTKGHAGRLPSFFLQLSILLHIPVTATVIFIATAAVTAVAATAAEHQLSFAAKIKIKDELLKVNLNDWQLTVSLYTETKATRILLPCLMTHNYSPTPEQASCLKTNIYKSLQ